MVRISNIERHKAEDIRTKGYCCFNHILGLPKKDGIEKPIFDYETGSFIQIIMVGMHLQGTARWLRKV
jgi:hypothetical protein